VSDAQESPNPVPPNPLLALAERTGKWTMSSVTEIGFAFVLLLESFYWVIMGRSRKQPVRLPSIFVQCMDIGIGAIPIISAMSFSIGMMLAIQGIYSLKLFGAESKVVIGVAFSMTREFGPLITGILVAGRSGSALAARIGTMRITQEVDALRVMGINPVRFLVAPALLASCVMVPALTFLSILVGLSGAGIYVVVDLGMTFPAYIDNIIDILSVDDVMHGLVKSLVFGILIAMIGVVNGSSVSGGAEGVGKVTTRSVVQAISAIIVTDMIFAFVLTRW